MKRFNAIVKSTFFFIILCSPVFSGASQTSNQSLNNGSYKTHVGDTVRYDYTKILNDNENYISTTRQLLNGTSVPINITTNVYFTITVANITNSTGGGTSVYLYETIHGSQYKVLRTNSFLATFFLQPGFDNFADAEAYYYQLQQNITSGGSGIYRQGDIIDLLTTTHLNSLNPQPGIQGISSTSTEYNWRTGWLQGIDWKQYLQYSNGTNDIYYDFVYQRQSNSATRTIPILFTDVLEVGSIAIFIAIPIIIGISYIKYSQKAKISGNSQSFFQYLQSKVLYSKKNLKKQPSHSTDKALETIESILEETGGSK